MVAGAQQNPVNALLNYGYALLQAELTGASQAGLDPYIGFSTAGGTAEILGLDVMEEFRSILVDNLVVR